MTTQKVNFKNSNNTNITMSGILFLPEGFDKNKQYAAIVVTHPGGGVKEQTASTYASRLAQAGFIAAAYDASYQGETTGEPRLLENPYIRVEDISAVIDYISTLPYVDENRIGAAGICAGAGYSINAAINDHRIKAVAGISTVNIGAMYRNGWDGTVKDVDAMPLLMMGADARAREAQGNDGGRLPFAPETKESAPSKEMEDAWEYYRTSRAMCPTAPGYVLSRSLTQLLSYDAYNFAEAFLTQPLQIVVGSESESRWMSFGIYKRAAASADKNIHVVHGANHMELYDVLNYVEESASVIVPFFSKYL
ncbi:MAG: alpha/beta hydrolase [Flavobacterium nitrogenifigens]|uniref:alpha/beta hydrolase n=1 Tax=Flavobacterium nitrogenifigens TaxID=1617283 RepID=UPI00280A037C|nr:alpha/beta hydrolase [Flavobacterium nitrogenifigens]MDQ8014570.1 alpha/beta hydrolase [Flavobacterium nitrogenifigens]